MLYYNIPGYASVNIKTLYTFVNGVKKYVYQNNLQPPYDDFNNEYNKNNIISALGDGSFWYYYYVYYIPDGYKDIQFKNLYETRSVGYGGTLADSYYNKCIICSNNNTIDVYDNNVNFLFSIPWTRTINLIESTSNQRAVALTNEGIYIGTTSTAYNKMALYYSGFDNKNFAMCKYKNGNNVDDIMIGCFFTYRDICIIFDKYTKKFLVFRKGQETNSIEIPITYTTYLGIRTAYIRNRIYIFPLSEYNLQTQTYNITDNIYIIEPSLVNGEMVLSYTTSTIADTYAEYINVYDDYRCNPAKHPVDISYYNHVGLVFNVNNNLPQIEGISTNKRNSVDANGTWWNNFIIYNGNNSSVAPSDYQFLWRYNYRDTGTGPVNLLGFETKDVNSSSYHTFETPYANRYRGNDQFTPYNNDELIQKKNGLIIKEMKTDLSHYKVYYQDVINHTSTLLMDV